MGGGSAEDLDQQLDEALEDFDESVSGGGSGSEPMEIDILNPMGSGSSGMESNEPVFEEGDLGEESEQGESGGMSENSDVAERAEQGASGSEGDSGAEGAQGSSGSESGGESSDGSNSGGGAAAPEGGRAGGGGSGQGFEGEEEVIPIPDDVGDGRDDDIVLRQIRDAAMKEKDPVLRERLWEEYRRIRDQR
jgi:hypothetical protein